MHTSSLGRLLLRRADAGSERALPKYGRSSGGVMASPAPMEITPMTAPSWRHGTKPSRPRRSGARRVARREVPVPAVPAPPTLLERIRHDLERNTLRARNGLKHLSGIGRPEVGCS